MDSLKKDIPNIKGLNYLKDYITTQHEQILIEQIDRQPWLNDLKRRVQHYGYKYDYKARKITSNLKIAPIPKWLEILPNYDQVIINEYLTGQGISKHIDCIPCFEDKICCISLLEECEMVFEKDGIKMSIILEPRSLLTIENDARYKWRHSIPARKSNIKNRRVSITFRKVILIK